MDATKWVSITGILGYDPLGVLSPIPELELEWLRQDLA